MLQLVEEEADLILNPHFNPDVMEQLHKTKYFDAYLEDPGFRDNFNMLRKNADLMIPLMEKDPRFIEVFYTVTGIDEYSQNSGPKN